MWKKKHYLQDRILQLIPEGWHLFKHPIDASSSVNAKGIEWPCRPTAEGIPYKSPSHHLDATSRLIGALTHEVPDFLADELLKKNDASFCKREEKKMN